MQKNKCKKYLKCETIIIGGYNGLFCLHWIIYLFIVLHYIKDTEKGLKNSRHIVDDNWLFYY